MVHGYQTPGDRFDTNLDDDPAGIARIQMAKESKARYAAEAKALAVRNANTRKAIKSTKAAEDDDIMDEEAGRMRLQLAAESEQRRADEAAALKQRNDEMKERLASTKACYLTTAGVNGTYFGRPSSKLLTPSQSFARSVPITESRSPSQQFYHKYYTSFYEEVKVFQDQEPTEEQPKLW